MTGPEDERAAAYQAALSLLSRADRSVADLRNRLRRRGHQEAAITAALERCSELGYLDDQRLARRWSEQLLGSGRAAGPRLLLELKKRGIDSELAATAAAAAAESISTTEALQQLRQRRYPDFNYHQADARERRRVVSFFQRRGFGLGLILEQLQREPPNE